VVIPKPQDGPEKRTMPLRTHDFEYDLPAELIAQYPPAERGSSRLLIANRQEDRLTNAMFEDFPTLLAAGDLLIVNTSRVRHARLIGTRPSGAPAEVLLIHPGPEGTWVAIGKPGSGLRPGRRIALGDNVFIETVKVLPDGHRAVRFVGGSAEEAIQRWGRLPLPPYIHREPDTGDETGYQTVYAERESSVAAPTAGLHFTGALLLALEHRGVRLGRLELAVGPGTFKPVETEDPSQHPMHPEQFFIPAEVARMVEETRRAGGRVWAVGTTVVRALESAAIKGTITPGAGETRLMITPGYRFQVVDRLLTNFHLPRSTLMMLVAAFAGYDFTLRAYRHAVGEGYRFYSYGDAMVVL
jgi:S-adenosylmethionine:tRNA ribosyltransferase-isomerase